MADEDLRQMQRDAAGGGPAAEARYLVERLRAGSLQRERLELAADLGHEPARLALDGAQDQVLEKGARDPALEISRTFRSLARLGKEAWVRAVVAWLRTLELSAGEKKQILRALGAAEAWLACPCEQHAEAAWELRLTTTGVRGGIQRFLARDWSEASWAAHALLEVVGRPWTGFRGEALCSGLTRPVADEVQAAFHAAGCLTRLAPDDDVPAKARRPVWRGRPLPQPPALPWKDLVLESCGPKKIAVIKAIRQATSLGLAVAKELTDRPDARIPTGLPHADAARLAEELRALGAQVRLDGDEDGGEDEGVQLDAESPPCLTLILEDVGSRKIAAIKEIRSVTGLGLREAKDLADRVGSMEPRGIERNHWKALRTTLRADLVPWLLD